MLDINTLPWVEDKIHLHCVWAKEIRDQFSDDAHMDRFVRLWLVWLNRHNFITLIGESGVVIARPCATFSLQLSDLTFFDLTGECLWVDFLWAPGQWPLVRAWLMTTGKKYGGWQRRDNFTLHTIDIEKLCSRHIDQKIERRPSIGSTAEHGAGAPWNGEAGCPHVSCGSG